MAPPSRVADRRHVIPEAYRRLLGDPRTRRLLAGLGASSLGDGMSTVTIAWLAVRIAPPGEVGQLPGWRLVHRVATTRRHR